MDNTEQQTLNVIPNGVFKEILEPFLDITSLVKMSKLSKKFSDTIIPVKQNKVSLSILNWLTSHSNLDPDLKKFIVEQNSDGKQLAINDLREILTKNKFLLSLTAEGMFYLDQEVLESQLAKELDVAKTLHNLELMKNEYAGQSFMTGSFVRPDQKWLDNPLKQAILEMKIDFENGGGIVENVVRDNWHGRQGGDESVQLVNILQNNNQIEETGYKKVEKFFKMHIAPDPNGIQFCVSTKNFDESKIYNGFEAAITYVYKEMLMINIHQRDQIGTKGKILEFNQFADGRTKTKSGIHRGDRKISDYNYQESNFIDQVNWQKDFPQFVFTGNKALDLGTDMDAGSMDAVQKLFSNQKIAKQFFEDEPIKDEDDENDKSDEELLQLAFEFKDKGNQYFKERKNHDAKLIYEEGIENIELIKMSTDESRQLAIILYQNFSLACLKIGEFQQSIQKCSSALSINQSSVKALYIRSQAYQGVRLFDQALNDIKAAIKLEPNDRGLRAFFHKLKIQKQKETQKQMDSMLALFSEGILYDDKDESDDKIDGQAQQHLQAQDNREIKYEGQSYTGQSKSDPFDGASSGVKLVMGKTCQNDGKSLSVSHGMGEQASSLFEEKGRKELADRLGDRRRCLDEISAELERMNQQEFIENDEPSSEERDQDSDLAELQDSLRNKLVRQHYNDKKDKTDLELEYAKEELRRVVDTEHPSVLKGIKPGSPLHPQDLHSVPPEITDVHQNLFMAPHTSQSGFRSSGPQHNDNYLQKELGSKYHAGVKKRSSYVRVHKYD